MLVKISPIEVREAVLATIEVISNWVAKMCVVDYVTAPEG